MHLEHLFKACYWYGTGMEPLVKMPEYTLFGIEMILKSLGFWYILLNLGPPVPFKYGSWHLHLLLDGDKNRSCGSTSAFFCIKSEIHKINNK